MSQFCNSVRTELAVMRRINTVTQILLLSFTCLFSSIALNLALTAATARVKHFGLKVVKYFPFAVLIILK